VGSTGRREDHEDAAHFFLRDRRLFSFITFFLTCLQDRQLISRQLQERRSCVRKKNVKENKDRLSGRRASFILSRRRPPSYAQPSKKEKAVRWTSYLLLLEPQSYFLYSGSREKIWKGINFC